MEIYFGDIKNSEYACIKIHLLKTCGGVKKGYKHKHQPSSFSTKYRKSIKNAKCPNSLDFVTHSLGEPAPPRADKNNGGGTKDISRKDQRKVFHLLSTISFSRQIKKPGDRFPFFGIRTIPRRVFHVTSSKCQSTLRS